jgi:phosphoglycolate phosphatase
VYALGKYRHVIWDWNGTLIDDAETCVEVLNELLHRRGKTPVTYEQYREIFDFPIKDYYVRLGFDFNAESFDDVAHEYIGSYREKQFKCSLHEGAVDALESCRDLGLTQSILSAYHQDLLEEVTQRFHIQDFFIKLVGRDDLYAHSKIDNGIELLAELGFSGEQVLLIGDTIHDYEVAQAMSTDCVLIANGHQRQGRLKKCGARISKSMKEIPGILKE